MKDGWTKIFREGNTSELRMVITRYRNKGKVYSGIGDCYIPSYLRKEMIESFIYFENGIITNNVNGYAIRRITTLRYLKYEFLIEEFFNKDGKRVNEITIRLLNNHTKWNLKTKGIKI